MLHKVCEETKVPNFLLRFGRITANLKVPTDQELVNALAEKKQLRQRAIGVIYHPETEMQSHYFTAETSLQYDSVIHIDESSALKAIDKYDFEARDEYLEKKEVSIGRRKIQFIWESILLRIVCYFILLVPGNLSNGRLKSLMHAKISINETS